MQAETIQTVEGLEERLSRPTAADREAVAGLGGRLVILGVAGKMGPSLAVRAKRAADEAGVGLEVIGVSRFSEAGQREYLESAGVKTVVADLLGSEDLRALPEAGHVVFMAGRKFGTSGAEHLTWAMNALVPALVAERYKGAKIVAFSSGNVYPLRALGQGGATEECATEPVGEYAQSVRARERMFELAAARWGTKSVLLRLNYAVDLRYGVLLDIGQKVYRGEVVDVAMGAVNVIWQGDANSVALRAFGLCAAPPAVLNITGPETLSVRRIAERFGRLFGVEARIQGTEAASALLNDAGRAHRLYGYPEVAVDQLIEWTAEWIRLGGAVLGKPTHFEARDGKY